MTKWDVYDWVIERVEYGDLWLEAYNDAVRIGGYEEDVFYQLQELGIIKLKLEVDEDRLQKFKDMIDNMRRDEYE